MEPKSKSPLKVEPLVFKVSSGHGATACAIISNLDIVDMDLHLTFPLTVPNPHL